ncbi:uncharacterized protein [Drosophila bipectinata]|uniref:uncharacterized protein n=1 Tax=Drosophila bipectinata TaxID=42026 RepID=UPI0038B2D1A5
MGNEPSRGQEGCGRSTCGIGNEERTRSRSCFVQRSQKPPTDDLRCSCPPLNNQIPQIPKQIPQIPNQVPQNPNQIPQPSGCGCGCPPRRPPAAHRVRVCGASAPAPLSLTGQNPPGGCYATNPGPVSLAGQKPPGGCYATYPGKARGSPTAHPVPQCHRKNQSSFHPMGPRSDFDEGGARILSEPASHNSDSVELAPPVQALNEMCQQPFDRYSPPAPRSARTMSPLANFDLDRFDRDAHRGGRRRNVSIRTCVDYDYEPIEWERGEHTTGDRSLQPSPPSRSYPEPPPDHGTPRSYPEPPPEHATPRSHHQPPPAHDTPRSYPQPPHAHDTPRSYPQPHPAHDTPRSCPEIPPAHGRPRSSRRSRNPPDQNQCNNQNLKQRGPEIEHVRCPYRG